MLSCKLVPVVFVAVFLLAGCTTPPPLPPEQCFAFFDSTATVYVSLDAVQNRVAVESFAAAAGFTGDLAPILDRSSRVSIAVVPTTLPNGLVENSVHIMMQGSYPVRIVGSQLSKGGWQKKNCTTGMYYELSGMYVAVPDSGLLLLVLGGSSGAIESFLDRIGHRGTVAGSSDFVDIPLSVEQQLTSSGIVIWAPNGKSFMHSLTQTTAITLPVNSVVASFLKDPESDLYSGFFCLEPAQPRMAKALGAMASLAASAWFPNSSASVAVSTESVTLSFTAITPQMIANLCSFCL